MNSIPPDALVGTTIGDRYEVLTCLQGGGMGVIFKARHVVLDKLLALKVLRDTGDEAARQRFLQEARAASMIKHSNVVDMSDFGVLPSGQPYLVMEFLEGQTLGDVLRLGPPLTAQRACNVAMQMARGLQAVHEKGIIHRDLKPDNIFLLEREGQRDVVKIVDFGIAKVHSGPRLTAAGTTLGTPEYMSPEQAMGADCDHRVDQYALGCMLYEMVTGVLPFEDKNPMKLLIKQATEAPVPPRQRRPQLGISPSMETIILRAMSKNRDDRFPSMLQLEQALQTELERFSSSAMRAVAATTMMTAQKRGSRRLILIGGIAAGLLGGLGYAGYRYYEGTHAPPVVPDQPLPPVVKKPPPPIKAPPPITPTVKPDETPSAPPAPKDLKHHHHSTHRKAK